jgi:hypothetical protein
LLRAEAGKAARGPARRDFAGRLTPEALADPGRLEHLAQEAQEVARRHLLLVVPRDGRRRPRETRHHHVQVPVRE